MSQNGTTDTIDLRSILNKVLRKWWLFVITVSIAVAGGVAYIKTTPKTYSVKSVLRMSEGRRSSFGAGKEEFLKGSGYLKTDAELEDEITMIRSVSNMSRTLLKLDFAIGYFETSNFLTRELYDPTPFVIHLDSAVLQMSGVAVHVKIDTLTGTYRVKIDSKNVMLYDVRTNLVSEQFLPKVKIDETKAIGQPFDHEHLAFSISLTPGARINGKSDYFFVLNSLDELLRQWQGSTSVDPMSEESNIVVLSTSGEVISKQEKFLNMLMATYIESEQEKNNKKGRATIDFIDAALGRSGKELSEAQNVLEVAGKGGVLNPAELSGSVNQELMQQQREESRLQSQVSSLQSLIATMNSDAGSSARSTIAAAGINSQSLNTLIDKYNQDVARLRTEELTVKIPTPPIIALRKTVQTEAGQIVASAESLLRQSETELASVQRLIAQLRGSLYAMPGKEIDRKIAVNRYELTQEIHNYLLEKSYEAQIAVNSDQVDQTVVDAARPASPTPIAPDKKLVLGSALGLGIIIPLLFILLMDMLNDKIAGFDELKRLSTVPILATIPTSKRKRITPDEPKSLLAESFRTARINLQYLNVNTPRQVLGVTSSTSGEGKTFCAINFATVMTLSGKRTLLIDADMRRPRVQEALELPDAPGLSTYLISECELDEAIRKSSVKGLDVITAGPIPPNPLELVESPRMEELFRAVRGRYDFIVFDASPMGLVSEFKVILPHLDVTLYVVRQGYTRRGMLRAVNELYREGRIAHVNLLLNDVKAGEGYGDGYGYYTK